MRQEFIQILILLGVNLILTFAVIMPVVNAFIAPSMSRLVIMVVMIVASMVVLDRVLSKKVWRNR